VQHLGAHIGPTVVQSLKSLNHRLHYSLAHKKNNHSKSIKNARQQAAQYIKKKKEGTDTVDAYNMKGCEEPELKVPPVDDAFISTVPGPAVQKQKTRSKSKRTDARGEEKSSATAASTTTSAPTIAR
jgi:thiol:disulfide interchange protein